MSGAQWSGTRSVIWQNALWFASMSAFAAISQLVWEFTDLLWFLLVVLAGIALLGLWGVFLIVHAIRMAWVRRARPLAVAAVALGSIATVGTGLVLFEPITVGVAMLSERVLLTHHRASYEEIIEAVRSGRLEGSGPYNGGVFEGTDFMIEPGPPLRLAFPVPGGLGDNWRGIVYDPTGAVEAATGLTPEYEFSAPSEVVKLFGGDIVSCSRLADDFFVCGFT